MNKDDLIKMIKDDEFGLLVIKPPNSQVISADERLIASFEEINDFFNENSREPAVGTDIKEHQLGSRLKSIRSDDTKKEILMKYDRYNLLDKLADGISSVNDLIKRDELGILDDEDSSLFEMKNVSANNQRETADYIAQRKPCKQFNQFEELFLQCHSDLKSGKRKLLPFAKEQEIYQGEFFVLKGVLIFIAQKGEMIMKNEKKNYRLRCIFENGTESDLLLRSLSRELYRNGRRVTDDKANNDAYLDNFRKIMTEDASTGFIYVLKSLSSDPKIQSIKNLYKIGFSASSVEERVRNPEEDPTYLMAPVKILSSFECYNFKPRKLEQLLHNFFGSACLNFDIFDKKGGRHSPREWFIAPLSIIEKVVPLIISGAVVNYRYDPELQDIVYRT